MTKRGQASPKMARPPIPDNWPPKPQPVKFWIDEGAKIDDETRARLNDFIKRESKA